MTDRPNYYSIITADVRYDNRLSDSEKLLFAEITSLTHKNGVCWASNRYFADLYDVSERTITRRIKNLEDLGHLKIIYTYKNNSRFIESRKIFINHQYDNNDVLQYDKVVQHQYDKIVGDIITSKSNNTSINIKDIVEVEAIPYQEIIDYLNIRTQKNYRLTDAVKTSIRARINEGFALDDFKTVIDKKCVEWSGTEMAKYLRPQTLFGTKFDSYLNQEVQPKKNSNPYLDMQFDSEGNLI